MMIELALGVLLGAYTGYVIYKISEFRSLREEACRAIFSFSTSDKWIDPLNTYAMSMRRHGHTKAADKLFMVANEIREMYGQPPKTLDELRAAIEDVNGTLGKFHAVQDMRNVVQQLKPNMPVLLVPRLGW
ncbi:hypothetical protein [Xanthomonas campestris]|uniref:hypothetical protein n=1 Tax=Xanthomonas campestris TaxID=339 RepID=UPI0011C03D5B|nr:hypothetical protein [Xanthomonas campestris]MEA9845795.1 hypothetical protein [Xanthomonas campestris pv. raphani]